MLVTSMALRCDHGNCLQQVGLSPQLGSGETLASLGIASLEEVVEEVAAVRLLAQLGSLGQLGLAVGHVAGTSGGQLGEHDLVKLELVDDGHGAALLVICQHHSLLGL